MKPAGAAQAFQLPPLILHPFSNTEESSLLSESSKASLLMQGVSPGDEKRLRELDGKLVRGRYAELRMLFYVGKDIMRWAEQCADTVRPAPRFEGRYLRPESFVVLLVENIPLHIREKLERWGVVDYTALFRRSFGLHAVIQELPEAAAFTPDFLRRYHRYLDTFYTHRLRDCLFDWINPDEVYFDMYASGEYSSMLEKSWTEDVGERA